ncbi:TPA: DUF4222 domain-containing protein [Salmonella enterica subsp. enterica serovar Muenchen]|nr:DUF4222 domain-containing protein [Salmonella enterica subsp. enterica serovar Muenchen]
MKKKNSGTGLTASGLPQPEIRPGDIYQDRHGRRVMIKTVSTTRIVYTRPGYPDECFCSPSRLVRDFTPIKKQTFQEWAAVNNPLEKTRKLRELINASHASRARSSREAGK